MRVSRVSSILVGVLACGLIGFIWLGMAYGKEKYVLGDKDHPWGDSWSKAAWETVTLREGLKTESKVKLLDTKYPGDSISSVKADTTENLTAGLFDKGGTIIAAHNVWTITINQTLPLDVLAPLVDGNRNTKYLLLAADRPMDMVYWFDLGVSLPITKIRFYPPITKEGPDPSRFPESYEFSAKFLKGFRLSINDGTLETKDTRGFPIFKEIVTETQNRNPVVEVKLNPPQLARFIELYMLPAMSTWEIAEFEVYGEGYVPAATYISDIIDLKEPASWGMIKWEGVALKAGSGAKVLIQTRTGNGPDPNIYFRKTGSADEETQYTEDGSLIGKTYYTDTAKLPVPARGHVGYDYDNWSPWSAPYPFEAMSAAITSPGPRRYIQIRADFINTPEYGGSIKTLEFEYSKPPSATELLAEIEPIEVKPAESTIFTYAVKPVFSSKDTGFNSLEVTTPVYVKPEQVKSLRIGGVNEPFTAESFESLNRFVVHFRRMSGTADNGKVLEVKFETMILRYGTGVYASVFDSDKDEVKQLVTPGDASAELASNSLSVRTTLGGSLISSVRASPKVITPNGDGLNDRLKLAFNVLQLTSPVPVSMKLYNLSGSLVTTVYLADKKRLQSGQYSLEWDGKDEKGKLVPPGVYVYQILVESDSGRTTKTGTVVVSY